MIPGSSPRKARCFLSLLLSASYLCLACPARIDSASQSVPQAIGGHGADEGCRAGSPPSLAQVKISLFSIVDDCMCETALEAKLQTLNVLREYLEGEIESIRTQRARAARQEAELIAVLMSAEREDDSASEALKRELTCVERDTSSLDETLLEVYFLFHTFEPVWEYFLEPAAKSRIGSCDDLLHMTKYSELVGAPEGTPLSESGRRSYDLASDLCAGITRHR